MSGVSIAEWRFDMRSGNEAFSNGALKRALAHFESAAVTAGNLARLAQDACFDSECATRALTESYRNVSDVCFRVGEREQALATLERLFLTMCAGAGGAFAAKPYKRACEQCLADITEHYLCRLEQCNASPERILSVHAITAEIEARSKALSAAA